MDSSSPLKIRKKNYRNKGCFDVLILTFKNSEVYGFPWWLGDKEPTCQGREHGFDPWSGKTPHAMGQAHASQPLSSCSGAGRATPQPISRKCRSQGALDPVLRREKPPQGEAHAPQADSSPHSQQPESPRSNEDPAQPKMKF